MNHSKNNLDDEWRELFGKASETPPPHIWDSIEKHLDEQNRMPAPLPLWKSRRLWMAAASALLVLGIGTAILLQSVRNEVTESPLGQKSMPASIPAEPIETQPAPLVDATSIAAKNAESPDAGTQKSFPGIEDQKTVSSGAVQLSRSDAGDKSLKNQQTPNQLLELNENSQEIAISTKIPGSIENREVTAENSASDVAKNSTGVAISKGIFAENTLNEGVANAFDRSLEPLNPLPYEEIKTYWQTRYVFFNPYAGQFEEEIPVAKSDASQLWAGMSVMPGAFNPNMKFQHESVYQMNNFVGPQNYSTSSQLGYSNRSVTGGRDQAKVSYQASAQVGFNLSKNWSLESGIGYLQGNSTSRSPGFIMDRITQESADLLPNAMASGSAHYSNETFDRLQLKSDAQNAAMYVPMDKDMGNNFSYLQVPAYLGYTLRPDKKFSYTVLAGGVTNFFLENKLETNSGYTLKTTAENNVYNNLNVSAAAGIRVSYKLGKDWNTNLTANYQRSLMNNFKDNLFLKSFPTVYGVSWGVRYSF